MNDAAGSLGFDPRGLERYWREQLSGEPGPLKIAPFKGGQSNPTYLVEAGSQRWVLRKKPAGELLKSAHAVEREYRVITALAGSGVPVPRTLALCEDEAFIGTPFYLMEYMPGRILWDPALPGLSNRERAAIHDDMNRVVAALHGIDPEAVGLADFAPPGNYFERQVRRWTTQYRLSAIDPIDEMERLIEWLPQHLPAAGARRIVHGDLRLDNMVLHATEPRVLAVLDWELSTLGDPLADLAYHMLPWRLSAAEFRGMRGADLAALGIPSEAAYLQRYCERSSRDAIDPALWRFALACSLFRLAAILQGIAKRAADGTAASDEARETGARARRIAEAGWRCACE